MNSSGSSPHDPVADASWRRTFGLDLARSLPQGIVDTAVTTFAVFLAERVFRAPDPVKVMLVAAPSLGLLLSMFALQVQESLTKGCPPPREKNALRSSIGCMRSN